MVAAAIASGSGAAAPGAAARFQIDAAVSSGHSKLNLAAICFMLPDQIVIDFRLTATTGAKADVKRNRSIDEEEAAPMGRLAFVFLICGPLKPFRDRHLFRWRAYYWRLKSWGPFYSAGL